MAQEEASSSLEVSAPEVPPVSEQPPAEMPPSETSPVVQASETVSESQPVPEESSSSVVTDISISSSQSVSGSGWDSPETSSSDANVSESEWDSPETSSSEITLIDTGDDIISTMEGEITPEAEEIITLFSNNDVFVEIEVIFTELEDEAEQEIQNEPTLADNTDEDPNVDLIDPSIVPDPPGPLFDPPIELPPEDNSPVLESQGETQSTIALLESLLETTDLTVRTYTKEILLDPEATHTCRADIFRADLQNQESARARVTLFQNKKKSLPSFLEIGALPAGLNVVFKKNKEYTYVPGSRETVIEFDIARQLGAWEGDFTIPIIYTLQGDTSSSVVCQINIIND